MPFKSKRQQRAMFGGHIPGMTKEDAHEWAHETKSIKKLPERAPAEKGKATLRSKKANGDMMQYFADHPEKHENYLDRKEADRIRRGKSKVAEVFRGLEDIVAEALKFAVLGSSVTNSNNVGKLRGMMTMNAMKAPSYAASTQAMNPTKGVISAMNKAKPH